MDSKHFAVILVFFAGIFILASEYNSNDFICGLSAGSIEKVCTTTSGGETCTTKCIINLSSSQKPSFLTVSGDPFKLIPQNHTNGTIIIVGGKKLAIRSYGQGIYGDDVYGQDYVRPHYIP